MRYRNWNLRRSKVYAAVAAMVLLSLPASALAQGRSGKDLGILHARLAEEVRHALAMLPY
jgi:hypothetical protein